MIDAVADLIEAGRAKVYTVDSYDGASWSNRSIELEQRARAHDAYEAWIVERVVPAIHADLSRPQEILVGGAAWAPTTRPTSRCAAPTSSRWRCACRQLRPSQWRGSGHRGDAAYFHNPMDYVEHLGGEHLDWLRSRVSVLLVCGQGRSEDTTGALDSTRALAAPLERKGIRGTS